VAEVADELSSSGRALRSVKVAARLEDADVGSLVYVDERGQVQSPNRYRNSTVARLAGLGLFVAGATWLYWSIGGPVGLLVGGALAFVVFRHWPAFFRLRRAVALLAADRPEDAEALMRRIRRTRGLPSSLVAKVDQNLARVVALQGRHEEALAFQESALRRMPRNRSYRAQRRTIEFARVITLVNLDRVADARQRLAELPRTLEGDYLRAQHATAQLYVAFGEGQHEFDPAFLREQAEIALSLPTGRILLGLIAWAEDRAGRSAEATRLLAIARERPGESHVRRLLPRLAAWMDSRPAG